MLTVYIGVNMKKYFLILTLFLVYLGTCVGLTNVPTLNLTATTTTSYNCNISENNVPCLSVLDTATTAKKNEKPKAELPFYMVVIIIVFGCIAMVFSFLFIIIYHYNKKK